MWQGLEQLSLSQWKVGRKVWEMPACRHATGGLHWRHIRPSLHNCERDITPHHIGESGSLQICVECRLCPVEQWPLSSHSIMWLYCLLSIMLPVERHFNALHTQNTLAALQWFFCVSLWETPAVIKRVWVGKILNRSTTVMLMEWLNDYWDLVSPWHQIWW